MYGSMQIGDVLWVWDYAKEEPVKKSEQTREDWAASERRKYEMMKAEEPQNPPTDERPF